MNLPSGRLRLTSQCDAAWLTDAAAGATCPNCGYQGRVAELIDVDYDLLGTTGHYRLRLCPQCAVRFTSVLGTVDYEGDELVEIGWPAYYAQMGAGIWPISDPLTRIAKPAGAKALEIGGAYGFGLDFCVNAKGWRGVGYDPSPLAGIGARELGLDIRQGYFTEDTLADGPWDVIISTEVIEHLNEPPAFLRLMRRAIADDGILLLTTPNADWITPALSNGELYALLAPGAHVVLQSPQSLRMALEAAGFAHVVVRAEESALVAYASPSPFTLEEDFTSRRRVYRQYLRTRAAASGRGSDLQLGFAGRALFDSVNDQDQDGAWTAWNVLNDASAARYGYRLEGLEALPPGAQAESLEGLAAKMPVGLGMILFSRAMQRLAAGECRQAVRPMLALAEQAIEALQSALDQRSLGRDRLSVSIAAVVRTELLLCDAEAGKPEAAEALLALGDKMAGWRGFVALVNAEAYAAAARLHAGLLSALPDAATPAGLRRDALLSLANFHLASGGDAALALPVADALAALGAAADEVRLGSFVRLVNGGRYEEALALATRHDVVAMAARTGGEAARDARLARAVLDLAVGDPAEVPGRLEGLEIDPARRQALLLGAFTGLVNDARHDEADVLAGAHDLLARLDGQSGQAAADARWAAMLLDLQQGRTQAAVTRILALEKAGGDKALLAGFYVDGFVRLVNEGRYDAARAMDDVEHRLPLCREALRQDALAALVMLDAQPGGLGGRVAERLGALAAAGVPEARLTELTLAALSVLGNRGEGEAARQVLKLAEPLLATARPPFEAPVRDALFASVVLHMQEKAEWPRGAAAFARLRDSLMKEHPPGEDEPAPPAPLFWPALRGEVVILQKLKRGEEAVGLLQAYLPAYQDAPEDLRLQVEGG